MTTGITSPFTFFISPVSYSTTRSPDTFSAFMAFAETRPLTRFLKTTISLVTPVPPNDSLFKRKAPTKSLSPSLTIHSLRLVLLSIVPLLVMNMPIPPSRNFLTFLAIQKSCIFENFLLRSLSPVVSFTFQPVTKGTLVMARSTLPFSIFVFSKPFISTFASGYSRERILPVVESISTAWILLRSLRSLGIRPMILPIPALPSRTLPPLNPRLLAMSHMASI